MFTTLSQDFVWATGIENTFIPQARPGLRALDEYALTQHYQLWQTDIDCVAETGVKTLRWGIPWYRVQPRPNQWDWEWVDTVLDYMVNVKGLTPILDLMHYGTPLWLENSFLNSRYAERVAEYAGAVAARYQSLIHYYTPLNEPTVNAEFCGYRGQWPPYLTGDDGYVKILLALAKGIVLTMQALRAEQPTMETVQVEALRHHWTQVVTSQPHVAVLNEHQYLCLDLVTGRVNESHPLYLFLRTHGVTPADLEWFQSQAVRFDYLGANFYPWSYGELVPGKHGRLHRVRRRVNGAALGQVLQEVYTRYEMPLLVTETSSRGNWHVRARWMDETIGAVANLRQAGVPVIGYTWFPLITMIDWAYRPGRQPLSRYLLHLGLYDSAYDADQVLQRHITPLVARYQQHISRPMPEVAGLPTVAESQPAPVTDEPMLLAA